MLPAVARQEGETLQWLTFACARLWPSISDAVANLVCELVEPLVHELLPARLEGSFRVDRFSLGGSPPKLGPIACQETRKGLRLRIGVELDAAVDVAVRMLALRLGVSALRFEAVLIVELGPFIGELPLVGSMRAYFLDPPLLRYSFTGLARVAELPILKYTVRQAVDSCVANLMVMPNTLAIPLAEDTSAADGSHAHDSESALGVLRVVALHARELPGADFRLDGRASSDPYLVVRFADVEWRTSTVQGTCNPSWTDEDIHDFVVYDELQRLSVQVFDADSWSSDDYLCCTVPMLVKEAAQHSRKDLPLFWKAVPLTQGGVMTDGRGRGFLQLDVTWFRLAPPSIGAALDAGCVLVAEIEELLLPARLPSGDLMRYSRVQVEAKVGRKTARTQFRLTAVGRLAAAIDAVDTTLQDVVRRAGRRGLDIHAISEITNLDTVVVEEILKRDSQQPIGAAREQSVTHGRVLSQLRFRRKLHIPVKARSFWRDVELNVLTANHGRLVTASLPLQEVLAALKRTWPASGGVGTIDLVSDTGLSAQLRLRLLICSLRPES
eukprot:TRINITY_DN7249_c0_g1_i1.p2 TRINITY_DN7249_c0_g1~~TRINITY_DN7249_c0_g1_i1.p2  ORF type:complete len:608 (+),score=162.79 TRINITY_DN7249_c0_g1_i1:163-1824(+)